MPPEHPSLLQRLRRLVSVRSSDADSADAVVKMERKVSQLDKRIDLLTQRHNDDRLLLRRIARLLEERQPGTTTEAQEAPPVTAPRVDFVPGDWVELAACPICAHGDATLVCEYNRFLFFDSAPDEAARVYNYSLCHGCGIVYARRRPVGKRYRDMLTGFRETLGRPGTATAWLNPGQLSDADREDLRRRARRGALVSEHESVSQGEWLPGALRDRMAVAHHVELIGSLLTLHKPRVLEVRPRTGAILEALRRSFDATVFALPIFESQQEMVRSLYGIPADALIDFERFRIPYEGAFDLVVSNHMLTHAIAPGEYLDAITDALAPGGHLYLYNEMDEVEFLADSKSIFRVMNPFHMQVFTPASLTRALAARGFEVVFLGHTDRIQMLCLARKAGPSTVAMPKDERKRRLRRYAAARDFAILSLPEAQRRLFVPEWDAIVERAVLAGVATLDERGRVQLSTAGTRDADDMDEHDA